MGRSYHPTAGPPQSAFGRTSSAEFQVELAESFHCLLKINLPRFPFSNDTLSVWKRTEYVEGIDLLDDDRSEAGGSESEPVESCKKSKRFKYDDVSSTSSSTGPDPGSASLWANIPEDEKVSDFSASCVSFLLAP
jgi:hypothetical protein